MLLSFLTEYRSKDSVTTFFESAAKIKIKRAPPCRRSFYNLTFITTKNKSYFIKLVYKTIK
jgi:hypothetical protein